MHAESVYSVALDIPFNLFDQLSEQDLDDAIDEIQTIDGIERVWYDHCCGCETSVESSTWEGIQQEVETKYAAVLSVIEGKKNVRQTNDE